MTSDLKGEIGNGDAYSTAAILACDNCLVRSNELATAFLCSPGFFPLFDVAFSILYTILTYDYYSLIVTLSANHLMNCLILVYFYGFNVFVNSPILGYIKLWMQLFCTENVNLY